jgi:hypothetical protein
MLYVAASAEDLSKADLRLHTRKGWEVDMEDSSTFIMCKYTLCF